MTHAEPHPLAAASVQAQAAAQAADPLRARAHVLEVMRAIQAREPELGAFACLADAAALAAQAGRCAGPLAGVPVGVKDIFDTADLPTRYGSPALYPALPARHDAPVVAALRRAGALLVGKTTTTEFAYLHPTATRNPAAPGARPAARRPARHRRWPRGCCRWRWAARRGAPPSGRRPIAVSSATCRRRCGCPSTG